MLLVVIVLDSAGLKYFPGIMLFCNVVSLSNHILYLFSSVCGLETLH